MGGAENYFLVLNKFRMPNTAKSCFLLGGVVGILTQEVKERDKQGCYMSAERI